MLQRLRKKTPQGPGKLFAFHHYINAGGWHVLTTDAKGEIDSNPVLYFGLAQSRDKSVRGSDGNVMQIMMPFISAGGGNVTGVNLSSIVEYFYYPDQIADKSRLKITLKDGKTWRPNS